MALLMPVYKRLEDFAVAMTRDSEEACDLVAETVLRAYENFGRLRDEQAFLGYLFSIASREHRHRRRRAGRFDPIDQTATESISSGGASPDAAVDVDLLYKALGRLPWKQREAVVLFEISGFSLKEIREIQGGSIAAIKVRLFRARKRLAVLLGADEFRESASDTAGRAAGRSSGREEDFSITLRTVTSE